MRALALLSLVALAACEGDEPPAADNVVNESTAPDAAAPAVEEQYEIDGEVLAAVMYRELEDDLSGPDTLKLQTGASDLNGDGEAEVLAYAVDPNICGSGGCSLYVLRKAGNSYRVISEIGPSQLPVYRLDAGPDGWAALGVTVYGGGMPEAVMAVPHEESGYAPNPTVDPASPVEPGAAPVIIAEQAAAQ